MILAVDIGNTNISIGLFEGDRLCFKDSLPTAEAKDFALVISHKDSPPLVGGVRGGVKRGRNYTKLLKTLCIEAAVVCSVVPKATALITKAIAGLGDIPIYVLGQDLIVPLKNLYGRPKQVGQDRLVCAWTAMRLSGAPVIVVDLGTAITFDAVSKGKEYLGGVILPGLGLSLKALHQGTALLPEVKLGKPQGSLIGKDTKGSMLSGIVYGFGALIEGLADKFRREIGNKAKVVLTGGDARLIRKYCSKSYYFEPDLILKGLKDLALLEKKMQKKT